MIGSYRYAEELNLIRFRSLCFQQKDAIRDQVARSRGVSIEDPAMIAMYKDS